MLRSGLYEYSDAYNVVKVKVTVEHTNDAKKRNKRLTFKKRLDHVHQKSITQLQTMQKILTMLF